MSKPAPHRWQFRARFRRGAFGWKSQPAIQRVKEAVREIHKVAKKDPVLAGEGAVLFLERVAPAIEAVDGSSGGIGAAVDNAVHELAVILGDAPADERTRLAWLGRLFIAFEEDEMPYLGRLGEEWGRICRSPEIASRWADGLLEATALYLGHERNTRGFIKEAVPCLSALFAAGRHGEIIALLQDESFWPLKRWEVKALAALGRTEEALRLATDASLGYEDDLLDADQLCEEILLAQGRVDEAYQSYGLRAVRAETNLAYFRAVAKKYPHKPPREILADLVTRSPGSEGKWFAASKSLGLYDEAIALVQRSPCDPLTLARAARDFEQTRPEFALEAGIAALRWIADGEGYEIDVPDVQQAFEHTVKAAARVGREAEVRERIRAVVAGGTQSDRFALSYLREDLGLS